MPLPKNPGKHLKALNKEADLLKMQKTQSVN
jgi:hypothetical protein